jgi:uncharacterized protein VirK/YbjX
MTTFAQAFAVMVREFFRDKGARPALFRALCSARAVALPGLMREMSQQDYLRLAERRCGFGGPWDPFHFISHPGYLVRGYGLKQRSRAALFHYRYEADTFDDAFLDVLYTPQGFTLWSAEVDGHRFVMRMEPAGEDMLEGDLRLRLYADDRCIGTTNFVWADSAMFGEQSGRPTIFITRCQSHTWPEIQIFRACFKQNSPPYFALAVLAAIGQVCGMREVYAVHAPVQMHYEAKYASSFQNSYDEFWEKFGAERITHEAFRMPLPLALRDLSELKSKHRSRAEGRRKAWGEVGQAAGAAVARHLRGAAAHAHAAVATTERALIES